MSNLRHKNFINERAGFTLIETIVALTIIVAAVVGPFSLATRGILGSSFAKNKIIAVNLAQEGMELVRLIRENNILAQRTWDDGLSAGNWQVDAVSLSLTPYSASPLLFDSASGLYSYASGIETVWVRKINISKPNASEMVIISEVRWTERGVERIVALQEKLYNWK